MSPSRARDADGDDRERLERAALWLAFARLVLRLLPDELGPGNGRDVA